MLRSAISRLRPVSNSRIIGRFFVFNRKLNFMAFDKEIHIHNHIDCCKRNNEILELLKEIKELLQSKNDEVLRQEIMDKLNAINEDIKSTIP